MKFHSLNRQSPETGFREAVIRGIAPDKGLYFPNHIPGLPGSFWENLGRMAPAEIGSELLKPFVGEAIAEADLHRIVDEVLSFDFPLVPLGNDIYSLELYHGPTMAFKDVGSRFMARCLGYFSGESPGPVTVLVATSGDTGGAVADGFLEVPGVRVVILYPEGKVSDIQERQLTTLGHNIRALRVAGTFDDCQRMVKEAFLDQELLASLQLTSANSINLARWLPQMIYFALASRQLGPDSPAPVFSVPSGNFGNICAGMLANRMGMPCRQFVAATNRNDTVPRFMQVGDYQPMPAVPTISNAMDVADPSNFIRIRRLFGDSFPQLATMLWSRSYTDEATRNAMRDLYREADYIADPHGAVGFLGLRDFLDQSPGGPGIFLETAHPIKFRPEVESTLDINLEIPQQIKGLMDRRKVYTAVSNYREVKNFLLDESQA